MKKINKIYAIILMVSLSSQQAMSMNMANADQKADRIRIRNQIQQILAEKEELIQQEAEKSELINQEAEKEELIQQEAVKEEEFVDAIDITDNSTQPEEHQLLLVSHDNQYNHHEKESALQTLSKDHITADENVDDGIVEENKIAEETSNTVEIQPELEQNQIIEVESSVQLESKITDDTKEINTAATELANALKNLQTSNQKLAADTAAGTDGRIWSGSKQNQYDALKSIQKVKNDIKNLETIMESTNDLAKNMIEKMSKYRADINERNNEYQVMVNKEKELYKNTSSFSFLGFNKEANNRYKQQVAINKQYLAKTTELESELNNLERLLNTINTDSARVEITNATAQIKITEEHIRNLWKRNSSPQVETQKVDEKDLSSKITKYANDNIKLDKMLAEIALSTNKMNALTKSLKNNLSYANEGTWFYGSPDSYEKLASAESTKLDAAVTNLNLTIESQEQKLQKLRSNIENLNTTDLPDMTKKLEESEKTKNDIYKHQGYGKTQAQKMTYNTAALNSEYYKNIINDIKKISNDFDRIQNKQKSTIAMAQDAITAAETQIEWSAKLSQSREGARL